MNVRQIRLWVLYHRHAFRMPKPWLIPQTAWKVLVGPGRSRESILWKIAADASATICVSKPSENLYLGQSVGALSAISASIVNLASHGEMAVAEIVSNDSLSPSDERLINLLPTRVKMTNDVGSNLIGTREGRLLNHFGYRKAVMNLVPNSLEDHAWIACALSYANGSMADFPFDPRGGSITGGIAGMTKNGAIFRGSGISDSNGQLASPHDALDVSLRANAESDLIEVFQCSITEFMSHRFLDELLKI